MLPRLAATLATLCFLFAAIPAGAQTRVHGTLHDQASGEPLVGGTVTISTNRGRWNRVVRTDSVGGWEFRALMPGPYRLRAVRLGYRESGGEVEIGGDSLVEVRIRLAVEAVALEPLVVVTERPPEVSPVLRGFYDRMRSGPGRFVTRAEIADRHPGRVTDLLRGIPNIQISASGSGGQGGVLSRGSAAGRCSAVVFVDGMRISHPPGGGRGAAGGNVSIDDYVQPLDVEGIEIYRGESDTPAEFLTRWAGCGTIVIWTRRGGRRG
jgi:hypothetical protein